MNNGRLTEAGGLTEVKTTETGRQENMIWPPQYLAYRGGFSLQGGGGRLIGGDLIEVRLNSKTGTGPAFTTLPSPNETSWHST